MSTAKMLHELFPNNWYFAYMVDLEEFYKEQDDAQQVQTWQQQAADMDAEPTGCCDCF
jgi:hypothetical protein